MVEVCSLFLSPVIIHPHGCCLWGWSPTLPGGCWVREERHSPWLVTPLRRKELRNGRDARGIRIQKQRLLSV